MVENFRSGASEDVIAGPRALLTDNAADSELGRFEDALLLEEPPRLGIETGGLFEMP